MPNWAVGTMKIRGKKKHIGNFLINGLKPVNSIDYTLIGSAEEKNYTLGMSSTNTVFSILGMRRGFVYGDIDWSYDREEKEEIDILEVEFKSAWGVSALELEAVSKQFKVDFNVYVFERGMEFNRAVEIINGEIVKDQEIVFQNYDWECIFSKLGG